MIKKTREIINSKAIVRKGDYEIEELVSICNGLLRNFYDGQENNEKPHIKGMEGKVITGYPSLHYDRAMDRVFRTPGIINHFDFFYISFDRFLGEILGFPQTELFKRVDEKLQVQSSTLRFVRKEDHRYDMVKEAFSIHQRKKTPIELVYITSDITDYSLVDNQVLSLLRILEVPRGTEENELLHYSFETPIYLPVNKHRIPSISIVLNNYFNNKLEPFVTEGDFFLVLHFRKIINKQIVLVNEESKEQKTVTEQIKDDIDPFMMSE